MKLKIRKATKHERKHLLKKSGSDGAFYENTIVVDATKSRLKILLAVIHELCRTREMSHQEATNFENRVLNIALKK